MLEAPHRHQHGQLMAHWSRWKARLPCHRTTPTHETGHPDGGAPTPAHPTKAARMNTDGHPLQSNSYLAHGRTQRRRRTGFFQALEGARWVAHSRSHLASSPYVQPSTSWGPGVCTLHSPTQREPMGAGSLFELGSLPVTSPKCCSGTVLWYHNKEPWGEARADALTPARSQEAAKHGESLLPRGCHPDTIFERFKLPNLDLGGH